MSGAGIRIAVRVVPRGGRDAVDGVTEAGELRCRVSAAPADGAANKALLRLVADAFGVPPSAVALEAGATSRTKRLRIDGVDAAAARTRWPGLQVRV
ncbi:MAG: DUF167 domain-containing protein [Chloroflexota bacterium]